VEGYDAVLQLEIAAWSKGREGGFDDVEMGLEADGERAAVDIVKLVGEVPGLFSVFDCEVAVWWVASQLVLSILVMSINEAWNARFGVW
jgi:hypothetical protein